MFYGFFFFRLKVNLIEFEFRFGHGSGRSVYSPSEYVQQIDDRYGVETFVDDNRFRCISRRFGFDDRFVETASDFGRVGESDIGVFAAVDRKGRFSAMSLSKVTFAFDPQKRWRRRSSKEMSTGIFRNISLYGEYVPCPCGWVGLGT